MLHRLIVPAAAALAMAACSGETNTAAPKASAPVVEAIRASDNPLGRAIDKAAFEPGLAEGAPTVQPAANTQGAAAPVPNADVPQNMIVKLQVLLDRAHFSPGVIDGKPGENVRQAVAAFERANGLTPDGVVDKAIWEKLTAADGAPVMQDYVITNADARGPFVPAIPKDYAEMAKMERLAYTSPLEALAEKFHMDQDLLKALNPNVDFGQAGTKILVARPGGGDLGAQVARVEVDKAEKEVRAFAADGRLLAVFPATIGSSDMPTPDGEWEVTAVANDPTWNYDPSKLNFGDKSAGKLSIPPGPNNPVGLVWIDLSKDTYGLHGTPEPQLIGKTASHGCVRMTNWDALALGRHVAKGAKVVFMSGGSAKPQARAAT